MMNFLRDFLFEYKVHLFFIILVLLIGGGMFFFWLRIFSPPSPNGSQDEIPAQVVQDETLGWSVLENLSDGYTVEYPIGAAWHNPSYTNVGITHSLRFSGKGGYLGNHFTMFIQITSDEKGELAETIQTYAESFGERQKTTFKGQDVTSISSSEETYYIFARNNAIWIVQHPIFSDSKNREVADRIVDSLILLTPQQIAESIQQKYGTREEPTKPQIVQMKLRDTTRKENLSSIQLILDEYFSAHGQYPISATEDKIFKGRQALSSLHTALKDESKAYLFYTQMPGDPREDFYYRYVSPDGISYLLTAQLEYGEETDCDRSVSEQVCMYTVRP